MKNDNTWIAIDPKGVIGEPGYEVADFIRNPMPGLLEQHDVRHIINNRINRFSEILGFPKHRIFEK